MNTKVGRWSLVLLLMIVLWFVIAPPRPWLNLIHRVNPTPETGARLVAQHDCQNCHRVAGEGALVGPDLDKLLTYADPMVVRLWLQNPKAIKSNTPMPNFHLSDTEIEAIMAYLETLKPEN